MSESDRLGFRFRILRALLLVAPLTMLTACSQVRSSFLDPGGPIAAAQRAHLLEVFGWTMIAIVPVFVLVPLMLWRYRYRNDKARYTPEWGFWAPLDVVMWGVPIIIIAVLATLLWRSTHALDPYRPLKGAAPPIRVDVVGLDWKWLFIYPDFKVATVNELAFPANSSVAMDITTDTVMQSFMIPALAGQIYAMPGMRTKLHMLADKPGTFLGANVQWSGKGFPAQKFNAIAMTQEDFSSWVAKVRAEGVPLDAATYGRLAVGSTGAQAHAALGSAQAPKDVVYFSSVDGSLFETVLQRYMHGAPVPRSQQPGAVGYEPSAARQGTVQ